MSHRVLIVDDNECFLRAARILLEREGMSVAGVASSTAEALREAEQRPVDVVLVDIALADESGFELARRLVEQNGEEDRAVIMISTRSEADFADLIAESPAAAFLAKSALSADAIRRVLDRRTRSDPPRA
jgi:CheY-like chemotaxis protein